VARRSANIRDPEIIKRFRAQFIRFGEASQRALDATANDVASITDWLSGEQTRIWKLKLRRRHEDMKNAWREYVNARHGDRRMGKPSCVDERKTWERAKRRKAEAEHKLENIKRWTMRLEREAEKLRPPCVRYEELLLTAMPRGVARLDHMLENLEIYLQKPAPKSE
jgi:hypothetical protein